MGDYQPHKEDTVITVHKGKRGSGMVEEKEEKCNEKESTRKTLLATAPSDSAGRTNKYLSMLYSRSLHSMLDFTSVLCLPSTFSEKQEST